MADSCMPNGTQTNGVFLDPGVLESVHRAGPFILPWPAPSSPGALLSFGAAKEWQEFVFGLDLRPGIPEIVVAKFHRAQMLHLLAWVYFDLIKAGELAALISLELALKDRYGDKVHRRNGRLSFADLLKYMVTDDGLTDDKVRMVRRCGGSVIGRINGEVRPSLAELRNGQAHGDPFDGYPCSGLLELVRDLIEYAYRDLIR